MLYKFMVVDDCSNNCAIYHGSPFLSGYEVVDCLSSFVGDMPNGCQLNGAMYVVSFLLMIMMFMI